MTELFRKLRQKVESTFESPEKEEKQNESSASSPTKTLPPSEDNKKGETFRIDLKTATRDELVQFVKKQNIHIKQMEFVLTKRYEDRIRQLQLELESLSRLKVENQDLRKLIEQKNQDYVKLMEKEEKTREALELQRKVHLEELEKKQREVEEKNELITRLQLERNEITTKPTSFLTSERQSSQSSAKEVVDELRNQNEKLFMELSRVLQQLNEYEAKAKASQAEKLNYESKITELQQQIASLQQQQQSQQQHQHQHQQSQKQQSQQQKPQQQQQQQQQDNETNLQSELKDAKIGDLQNFPTNSTSPYENEIESLHQQLSKNANMEIQKEILKDNDTTSAHSQNSREQFEHSPNPITHTEIEEVKMNKQNMETMSIIKEKNKQIEALTTELNEVKLSTSHQIDALQQQLRLLQEKRHSEVDVILHTSREKADLLRELQNSENLLKNELNETKSQLSSVICKYQQLIQEKETRISELETQLNALKDTSLQNETLQNQLTVYCQNYEQCKEQLKRVTETLEEKEEILLKLQKEFSLFKENAQKERDELQRQLLEANISTENFKKEAENYKRQLDHISSQLTVTREDEIEQQKEKLQQSEAKLKELNESYCAMKNQFEELQQQTELLKQQLNIKSKQIEELRCHHVSKDSLILESQTQTPEELKRETEQKTELFEKCHHLESQINELRQNLLSAENIINLKEKEIEELKSVVTTIKTQLKLRDDEIALLRSEQANPKPPSDELKNEIHSEAKEHKQFDGCLQKLANDLDERNRQLQEMSQAYEEEKRRRQIVENEIQNAGQEKLKWIQTKTKLKGKLNDATQKLSALVVENQKLVESIQRLTQQSQNETESLQKIIEQQQHAIDELQCKLRQEEEKCQFLQSRIESFENVSFASSQSLATPTKEAASDLNKKQNDSHYMIETQTEVIERLQQRITELEKFAEIKEESLKECNVKLKTLQEALNEKKDQIVALQNSNEANVCKLQSLQHELDQARQRIQELNDTLVAQDNDSTPKKAQEVTNVDSHNVIALQETIAKQQSEISQLREKIRGLKQLLLKAHQHISDSNKTVAETKEQLQIAKQENVELQQKIAKMERQQNQNVDELVRIKAQEEIERRLSQLVKVHREKEIAFESEIQSLKDKLKEVEEEFRGYRARAQLAMSSNKEGVEQRGDGTLLSPSESEDDITRKLRQKLSETKRTLISLSGVQEELQKTKLELQRKSEELEQMQKRHLELVTKCNDLNLQLEQEQQKFKDKKRRYRDTLKLIDEKHAKELAEIEEKYATAIAQLTSQHQIYKEQTEKMFKQKEDEITSLRDTIELMKQAKKATEQILVAQTVNQPFSNPKTDLNLATVSSANSLLTVSTSFIGDANKRNDDDDKQLLQLAQLQASRDDDILKLQQQIKQLKLILQENEKLLQLHEEQERALKQQIRDLLREKQRVEGMNLEYLKNVIVKFMETDDFDSLLPVITTLLQLSPEEIRSIKDKRAQRHASPWKKLFQKS